LGPLLKLLKEGKSKGQEHATRAIGLLGHDPESVDNMKYVGACFVFEKILKESASCCDLACVGTRCHLPQVSGPESTG